MSRTTWLVRMLMAVICLAAAISFNAAAEEKKGLYADEGKDKTSGESEAPRPEAGNGQRRGPRGGGPGGDRGPRGDNSGGGSRPAQNPPSPGN